MPSEQTKQLCKLTKDQLRDIRDELDHFLSYISIPQLLKNEQDQAEKVEYVREFLRDLRHLSVACEIGYEKVSLVLRRARFKPEFAEKVLSEIVHSCIYSFYYPKHEVYEEDGRYSYTNQDAIKFRHSPPEPLRKLTISLSKKFEVLRDELDYYETDYFTRLRMRVK
ncbi:DUF3907 family protein [Thermoactinomyces mirandus]|uniref:DUF3907 family protein n=1 Tax=Thermoactinomyces mirandus TaxID=2756294 RepID=A0A7W1XQP2_9BACL|nr:DUF3907 family protein [Thermoactinomyces mirandus]MBA4601484.1 DUF3907 family protein [Thermoactinomyces mirandus]